MIPVIENYEVTDELCEMCGWYKPCQCDDFWTEHCDAEFEEESAGGEES